MDEIISYFKIKRNLINTLLFLVIVVALPLGVNLARQEQILRSRAVGDPIKFTGPNVEKRADKWVAKSPKITLELISSLGAPGGSGPSGAGLTPGVPIGGTSSTWQSPDMKFQSKIPKDVNQIIAGAGGASDWGTLYSYADKVVGGMGHWLTPQQANEFMRQRQDIYDWWQKGSGPDSPGISPFFEPPDAIHAWLPGALKPGGDRDGLQLLINIAHHEDSQGISNPDQIIARFPEVKESIISMINSPEGSDGWPATCFLREWMKIGPNDPNAKLARKVMQQMPGQVGFDDAAIAKGCDFDSHKIKKTDASPLSNLMSFTPKGLVGEVKAVTQGQCDADSDCPSGNLYCEGPATWICEGVCVDHGCGLDNCHFVSGDPAGCAPPPPPPTCEQQLVRDVCFDCNKSQPLYYDTCTQSYLTSSIRNNPTDCGGPEWCGGGSSSTGIGGNIPPIRGVPCAEGYSIQCDAGNSQTGIQICKPGIVGSDGTCQFDEYVTNCYGLNVTTGEYDQYNQCNVQPTGSIPGPGSGNGIGRAPGAGTGAQCPALTCEYSEVDSSCPSGYRIVKGTGATGFNEPGCTYKEGCSTSQCAPGDSKTQPPAGTKPAGTTPSPKTSPSPGGGSPRPTGSPGTGTVTTVSFKIAENPDELASAPEQPYTGEPMIVNFEFKDKTPGNKFVWVEFKASTGKTARHSAQIKLLGDDPKITGCKVDFEGSNVVFELIGSNFGTEQGTVLSRGSGLQVRDWKSDKVKVSGGSAQAGQATPVTLTTADGQKAEGQCSATSQLSLGAKTFCRAPQKHDQDNVEIALIDEDGKKVKEKVRVDKDGNVQNLQTRLVEGKKYKVSLKAPSSLRRQAEFTASSGTTNLPNFILPVGDIFPQDSGDGKINTLDKAELNRQWVIAQSASGRSGDFNQDGRVNSIDWACMRFDFGKENDPEASEPPKKDEPKACAQVITPAKNKQTGECKDFPNACIPDGWEKVVSCPKT